MEGQVPGWIALFGNMFGIGLLVWSLNNDKKKAEAREERHAKEIQDINDKHDLEMEVKNKEIIASRDAQISLLKEVLSALNNNNVVISTTTAAVQKVTEKLNQLEAVNVTRS